MYKQIVVLDKNSSQLIDNKYRFTLNNFRIMRWKVKKVYFPGISQTTQNTNNITQLTTQQTTNTSDIQNLLNTYTNSDVDAVITLQINNLIDAAPSQLNTLNELASALNDDANFGSTITTSLSNKANIVDFAQSVLPNIYYFDSSYSGTGDGSKLKPYTTISSFADILASTPRKISVIFNNNFTISSTIHINHVDWDICINGMNNTIISSADISISGFVVDMSERFVLKNLELNTFKYGCYIQATNTIIVDSCRFIKCGSSGILSNHDGSETQNSLSTKYNTGVELNNGGALRCHNNNSGGTVRISNCYVLFCLRGIRVQQSDNCIIYNNIVRYVSDNGYYVRDINENCLVSDNLAYNIGNIGLLSIRVNNTVFKNNVVDTTWGAAFCDYYSSGVTITDNTFKNCCIKGFNGWGGLGDHQGQYAMRGALYSSTVDLQEYRAKIINNSHTQSKNHSTILVHFDDNTKSSYSGGDLVYFENIKYETGMSNNLGNDNWAFTSLNQEINNFGSRAIITGVERTQITNNTTSISNKENTLSWSTVADNHVSNPVTSAEIKNYVDNAGGYVLADTYRFDTDSNTNTYEQLTKDIRHVAWGRGTYNLGDSAGGEFKYILPPSADISTGHVIYINTYNLYHSPNTNNGGTIFLKLSSGQMLEPDIIDDPHIETYYGDAKLTECDRNCFVAIFLSSYSGNSNIWCIKSISHRLTDTQISTIDALSINDVTVNHIFANNESSYAFNGGAPSSYLQLADDVKKFRIIYGDQTDFSSTAQGIVFFLPINPPNGCHIRIYNTIYNDTRNPAQNSLNNKNISVGWGAMVGVPTTRRLQYQFNSDISLYKVATGSIVYRHFYAAVTPVIVWDVFYSQPEDCWICRNCTS